MVRRSVRLAKPEDRPQVEVFHDLDTAAVSAKSQKLEEAARARKRQRLEHGGSTSSADSMIRDAMAGSDDLRDGHKPALYRGSQLNAQLSADDPRSEMYAPNLPKKRFSANEITVSNETAYNHLCCLFQQRFVA